MLSVLVLSALAASPGHGSAVTGPGCGRHCSGHCTPGLGAVGPLLSSANDVPSACACLRLCADDPVAQAWQWVSKKGEHNYRTCYLKGTVDLQPNPVYVSGCMPKGRANATARCPARPPAPPVPPVPPGPPGPAFQGSPMFPETKIISPKWGTALDEMMQHPTGTGGPSPVPAGQVWKLCYSSDTMPKNSAMDFHSRCDPYNFTLTVAHTFHVRSGTLGRPDSLVGVTFGGFVRSLQTTCPQLSCVSSVLALTCISCRRLTSRGNRLIVAVAIITTKLATKARPPASSSG